ncbi:MAG: carboxypeptidase-like regulatory domain-containing protein [Nanoarchaeota archaeon]
MQKGCAWFLAVFVMTVISLHSVSARDLGCSAYQLSDPLNACSPSVALNSNDGPGLLDDGYGAVEVCGLCYVCGDADGVCPEEFKDASGNIANCSACADPDCQANIFGYVRALDGAHDPIPLATVKAVPNNPLIPEVSAQTLATGMPGIGWYNLSVTTGTYVVSASKIGFDTEIKEGIILTTAQQLQVDFLLPNGTCHEDCSDYFGRCNAACEGIKGCSYDRDYYGDLCDGRRLDEWVEVKNESSGNSSFSIQCCIGDVTITEYRPPYSLKGNMKDLITTCRPVTYGFLPVRVCVATWRN